MSLAERKPIQESLVQQWHPTKNGDLSPSQFSSGSNHVAWWSGECGHEWEAKISTRTQGRGCGFCSGKHLLSGFNDLATTHPDIAAEWHPELNNPVEPTKVFFGTKTKFFWKTNCEHTWQTTPQRRKNVSQCPTCLRKQKPMNILAANALTTTPEHPTATQDAQAKKDIKQILNNLGVDVEENNRTILQGKEIDLYLPSISMGIEFNGLYWHSENQGKGKNYHHDKWLACKDKNIQLLQIWEDDWNHHKPAILRALAHKLGVTDKLAALYPELVAETTKVFARKTKIVLITTAEAKQFLEQNHIQGYASGTYYVGLKDPQGVLRALIVLKREVGDTLNIIRYATAGSVTGGFTKLLTYATKTYHPDSYITFADHTISDGGLYENNGFVVDKEIRPDYMYVVRGQRKHKFGYRLKKFRTDPNLLWDENLSERELAILNNLPRIWDAGKTRYRLEV